MQILVAKARAFECLPPMMSPAVARPCFAERVAQDRALWFHRPARIERGFEGGADGNHFFPFLLLPLL